jgi:hypothetical protein
MGVVTPACWTVACASPTMMLPARTAGPVFAGTTTRIVALPVPLDGDTPAIQSALPFAVHWHPGVAVTAKETSPPGASTVAVAGDTEYLQGAAAWTTFTDSLDTTTCACRDVPFGFG